MLERDSWSGILNSFIRTWLASDKTWMRFHSFMNPSLLGVFTIISKLKVVVRNLGKGRNEYFALAKTWPIPVLYTTAPSPVTPPS